MTAVRTPARSMPPATWRSTSRTTWSTGPGSGSVASRRAPPCRWCPRGPGARGPGPRGAFARTSARPTGRRSRPPSRAAEARADPLAVAAGSPHLAAIAHVDGDVTLDSERLAQEAPGRLEELLTRLLVHQHDPAERSEEPDQVVGR